MRNLIISIIFLGIVGYLGTMLYNQAFLSKDQDEQIEALSGSHVYSYPAAVNIKNAVGREMMVTLLGRSEMHIQFARQDGKKFVYPISSLDLAAQTLISKYPNDGIKNAVAYMDQGSLKLGDLYVQELEKRIREIDKEVEDLSRGYASSNGNTEKRTIRREVEKLQAERVDLQSKIADRQ